MKGSRRRPHDHHRRRRVRRRILRGIGGNNLACPCGSEYIHQYLACRFLAL